MFRLALILTFTAMAWSQARFASVQIRPLNGPLPQEFGNNPKLLRMRVAGNTVTMPYYLVWDLTVQAFPVSWAQIVWGASPLAWRDDDVHYAVAATLPAGASVMQIPAMTETLLKEKFGLQYHRENRMTPIFSMAVDPEKNAKLRVELRKANAKAPLVVTRNAGWSSPTWDLDMADTAAAFAAVLADRFHIQVRDATRLSGLYVWHATVKTISLTDGEAHIVLLSGTSWRQLMPRPLLAFKEAGVQLTFTQAMLPNIVIDRLNLKPAP